MRLQRWKNRIARRRGMRLALGALALGLVGLLGFDALEHEIRPKKLVEVEPGLYRSGQISPRLIRDVLEEHRIGQVVWMLHYDASKSSHRAEKQALDELGIPFGNYQLRGDGTGKITRYADAIAAIARARRAGIPVLVHCAAGARRSAAAVAMYLLLVEGRAHDEVYRELDRFGGRPVAESPLLAYLNDHMEELAELLVQRGVIERAPDPLPLLRPPAERSLGDALAQWLGIQPDGALAAL